MQVKEHFKIEYFVNLLTKIINTIIMECTLKLFDLLPQNDESMIHTYILNHRQNIRFLTNYRHGLVANALYYKHFNIVPLFIQQIRSSGLKINILFDILELLHTKNASNVQLEEIIYHVLDNYSDLCVFNGEVLYRILVTENVTLIIKFLESTDYSIFRSMCMYILGEFCTLSLFNEKVSIAMIKILDNLWDTPNVWRCKNDKFWMPLISGNLYVDLDARLAFVNKYQPTLKINFKRLLINILRCRKFDDANKVCRICPDIELTDKEDFCYFYSADKEHFIAIIEWLLNAPIKISMPKKTIMYCIHRLHIYMRPDLMIKINTSSLRISLTAIDDMLISVIKYADADTILLMFEDSVNSYDYNEARAIMIYSPYCLNPSLFGKIVCKYRKTIIQPLDKSHTVTLLKSLANTSCMPTDFEQHLKYVINFSVLNPRILDQLICQLFSTSNIEFIHYLIHNLNIYFQDCTYDLDLQRKYLSFSLKLFYINEIIGSMMLEQCCLFAEFRHNKKDISSLIDLSYFVYLLAENECRHSIGCLLQSIPTLKIVRDEHKLKMIIEKDIYDKVVSLIVDT